ncbi:CBASS cGAMP-activated phospholipase [Leptospira ilyithenensis]|uniref:PNPLA domain-containing protein n=1 Tax=Leptospira ilyithenensis TaxID=2484901 RepID=A0A4R9LP73_9LEPT|nr:CBASS cGAMP-activated phospholipase [Leptospira ilyithenensis]TGN09376.1 hypothetical protein EHS11_12570 [Leptospira ilyithenensis]
MKAKNQIYRVLSIDGGGIKGIYAASLLATLEKHYKIKIHEQFDLICGTSTGGIISLGLSLGISASDILQFYLKFANQIFPKHRNRFKILNRFIGPSYKQTPLKDALTSIFHNHTMKDLKTNVCIPAVDINTGKPIIFKKDHRPYLTRDNETYLVDVALSTSAAPTYFPIHSFEHNQTKILNRYTDGGLCYNNPSLIGFIEFIEYFYNSKKNNSLGILSIGNISSKPIALKSDFISAIRWLTPLIELIFSSQSSGVDYTLSILQRTQSTPLKIYERVEEKKSYPIELDSSDSNSLNQLASLGSSTADHIKNRENIKELFGVK